MKIWLLVVALTCLVIGYSVGRWQTSDELRGSESRYQQCTRDLRTAVARGVTVEAQLEQLKKEAKQ